MKNVRVQLPDNLDRELTRLVAKRKKARDGIRTKQDVALVAIREYLDRNKD